MLLAIRTGAWFEGAFAVNIVQLSELREAVRGGENWITAAIRKANRTHVNPARLYLHSRRPGVGDGNLGDTWGADLTGRTIEGKFFHEFAMNEHYLGLLEAAVKRGCQ
jgi:hypothetical protein